MRLHRTPIDELIAAALRGEACAWQSQWDVAEFIDRAAFHGVDSLLHSQLSQSDWPLELLNHLRERAVQRAMWELRHQQVLTRTLAALERSEVQPVLIKGTALAYSLYADPAQRSRGDTDLIIPIDRREHVHDMLLEQGYERSQAVSGEFISYQANYSQATGDGHSHTLDVHWKINNSELLSQLFSYNELRTDARRLLALCPQALGTSNVHAMLIACMHRCTHRTNPYHVDGQPHYTADRLVWLYDIHLLACAISGREWEQLARLAAEKGLRAVCLEGLQQAAANFKTQYPSAVIASLERSDKPERPAQYLGGSKVRQQWMDFRALGNFTNQLRFARELFLPPATYMRDKYPDHPRTWLPWLYFRRAVAGMTRRLMEGRSTP